MIWAIISSVEVVFLNLAESDDAVRCVESMRDRGKVGLLFTIPIKNQIMRTAFNLPIKTRQYQNLQIG